MASQIAMVPNNKVEPMARLEKLMYSKLYAAITLAFAHGVCSAASLSEVTEHALANNPDVRARLHSFLSAGQDQEAARGGLYPRVDLQAYYGRERIDDNIGSVNRFNHPGVSLQLRQLLFDGSGTRNEIRRLGHAKATRFYELLASTDDTALEAARAYLDVQRYRQLSQLAQDNWAIHKETYDQIEQRVKAGVGRRVDLEQAAGRLALAQSNWLTETSNLHDVGARFQRVVGEEAPVLVDTPNVAARLPTEKDVLSQAIRGNPSFLAAVSNVQAARAQTDVRRSANSPTFELQGSHNLERNHTGVPGHYSDSVAQVIMNYNIFRGGSDQARLRSAEEQYSVAIAQRDKSCADLRQTAAIAWNDLRKLREQIRYLEQHALSTEKARDAYRQQFDIGQRSLLDVLDTENELFEARRALVRGSFELKLAEFRVLAASHRILPTLGLASPDDSLLEKQGNESIADSAVNCDTTMPAFVPLDTAAAMVDRSVTRPTPVAPIVPLTPPPAAPAATATAPAANLASSEVEKTVRAWADAWSARDLSAYMNFYSAQFQPMTVADQRAWRTLRAKRLDKKFIKVDIQSLKIQMLAPDRYEASFRQSYSSNNYSDTVPKKLTFVREGTSWKIVKEAAPPAGTN